VATKFSIRLPPRSFCASVPRALPPNQSQPMSSRGGLLPARPPLGTVRESFPSYGSSPHKANPTLGRTRGVADCSIRPLGNSHLQPPLTVLLRQQLRDASTDGCRSSFAFPISERFHILSCHFGPDRRGHIQRVTRWRWLLRSS